MNGPIQAQRCFRQQRLISILRKNRGETLIPHSPRQILVFPTILGETVVGFGLEVVESVVKLDDHRSLMARRGCTGRVRFRGSDLHSNSNACDPARSIA